jgi:protein phosphatase 1K
MWRRGFMVFASKNLRFCTLSRSKSCLAFHSRVSKRSISSPAIFSGKEKEKTLRLWSDSGGDDVASSPFDDLGAWHEAEAKSFLHNVSVDSVGASTNLGKKLVNEDRYKLLELDPDFYYFAVFDGHGGSEAVDFVQGKLHHIIQRLHKNNKDLEKVLVDAFEECNYELEKHIQHLINEQGKKSLTGILLKISNLTYYPYDCRVVHPI